jgi:toxin ParE1/3/4
MRLEISAEAERDLAELHLFGTVHYGETNADQYLRAILDEFQYILDWPLANPERREVRPPIRLRSHGAHNLFYDVNGERVSIVRVLHYSADWMNSL